MFQSITGCGRRKRQHTSCLLSLKAKELWFKKKEENDIVHNFVPLLLVLLIILKIKDTTYGRLGHKQIKNYIFPPRESSDSIEKETLQQPTPPTAQKTQSMEPTDAPKFTLRRYLIDMLLEFSASTNVIVPLGDLVYHLCDRDGDN